MLAGLVFALVCFLPAAAQTDEGWVVRSFQAAYQINQDGSVDVTEDMRVDFGTLSRHGIFRDIPVEYAYDAKHRRRITITVIGVDDGQAPHKYERTKEGANLRLRVGDPGTTVTGTQRYRIRYRVTDALNPQPSRGAELYWNVTGNAWPVPVESASATVTAPAVNNVTCFEGPTGSTANCQNRSLGSGPDGRPSFQFSATRRLPPGSGLTVVVGLPEAAVQVPPLDLVEIKSAGEQVRDFAGAKPLPIAGALLLGLAGLGLVSRYWWLNGRDRWFGDVHYLRGGNRDVRRPLFARDTVVVEYEPPEISARGLRPAEIGVLMDERADTLDVSASIVDLAVRDYLRITEVPKKGWLGGTDYRLERLKSPDSGLLPYEKQLLDGLFETGSEVTMSSLEKKFYDDLSAVKTALYEQVVQSDKFFAGSPEKVRRLHAIGGVILAVAGVAAGFVLASLGAGAVLGVPVVLTGLLLLVFSRAMPRRTAAGREMFRRCLGFREYMEVAETDRQRFNEEAGIFERYLPFAIVFGCTEKWAKAFEGMESQPRTSGWYVGPHPFVPLVFASNINSFSSAISSAIASTPGGSGGSGFSGGFSGGGGGGGAGGSW